MARRRNLALVGLLTVFLAVTLATPAAAADLDCPDFDYQEEAQAVLDRDRNDPHRLDADDDGIACETRPRRGRSTVGRSDYPRDWTGDGRSDLMAIGADGSMRVFPGSGRCGFGVPRAIGAGWGNVDLVTRSGDWDGDGRPDLLARRGADLVLYGGNGKGGFAFVRKIGSGWSSVQTLLAPGDWTGDGKPDLLVVRSDTGSMHLYIGNGRGGFVASRQIGGGWGSVGVVMSVGDWNGDRRNDLMVRGPDGVLRLYPGNGRGGFGAVVGVSGGWAGFTGLVGPGDATGDGRPDIVVRSSSGALSCYRGNGSGGFLSGQLGIGSGWSGFRLVG